MRFVPTEPIMVTGGLRAEIEGIGIIAAPLFEVAVVEPDMIDVSAITEADQSEDTTISGVWDGQPRVTIPAFGPGRPNPTHVHVREGRAFRCGTCHFARSFAAPPPLHPQNGHKTATAADARPSPPPHPPLLTSLIFIACVCKLDRRT